MIPAPILSIVAPLIADAISKPKAKAKVKEGLLGDAVEDSETPIGSLIREAIDVEKAKSSVRPRTMRQVWLSTILTKIAYIAIAAAPGFTEMSLETSSHALDYILYLLGGQVSYLGYAHGTRTIEKVKGKA